MQVPLTAEEQRVFPPDAWESLNLERSKAAFDQLAWLTERLSLPDQLKDWNSTADGKHHGRVNVCACCAPPLPRMRWVQHKNKLVAQEDQQQAAEYETRIKVQFLPLLCIASRMVGHALCHCHWLSMANDTCTACRSGHRHL